MADLANAKLGDTLKTQNNKTFTVSRTTKTTVVCECGARFMMKSGVQVGADDVFIAGAAGMRGQIEAIRAELVVEQVAEVVTEAPAAQDNVKTSDFALLQRLYELDIQFKERFCNGGEISKNGVSGFIRKILYSNFYEIIPVNSTWGTVCSGNLNAVLHLFNLVATSGK
jgi:hypothetical protein